MTSPPEMTVGVQSCRCHPHANAIVLCDIGTIRAVSDRLCWSLFGGLQGKRLIHVCSSESGEKQTNRRNPVEVTNETGLGRESEMLPTLSA